MYMNRGWIWIGSIPPMAQKNNWGTVVVKWAGSQHFMNL